MSLEPGWAWVEGDDWRIDWIGEWSPVGVDEEGFIYTDADWLRPAPYPYGHKGQRTRPPRASRSTAVSTIGDDDSDTGTIDEALDEEEEGTKLMALTRRRRWLRRAVRIKDE